MEQFPTGSRESSLISEPQTSIQLSPELLNKFDILLGLIEKQYNRRPSHSRPQKVRKEYLEKVKSLKSKLAKQSGKGVSDCMSMLNSIENYFYSDNEYSHTDSDSYNYSESSLEMDSSYSGVEKKSHMERILIKQVLDDYYSSSKSHRDSGKQRHSHCKSYSFQTQNKNEKYPANKYLVRKNKVAVVGALLQQVVQDSSLDSGKITADDFGLTNEIKVRVLESLLQEAVQKLNFMDLRGYIDKESIRKVAVLRNLLKQTEHEAHINPKGSMGYKKLSSGDSSKLQRTAKFFTHNFVINTRDKITVLTELLQLAILEFNTNYKSEIFDEHIEPNYVMPCTNRLPKNSILFPAACDSKSQLRNVLNLDSEIYNMNCGVNTGPGQQRDLKREINYYEFQPINIGQDKTVEDSNTWNWGSCSGYRNNPRPTEAMKQSKCGKCLSRRDEAIINSLLNCNVENKGNIQRCCSKNLENEDLQTIPIKLCSKKHHLANNCTQTSIEDTRDLLVNISCKESRSNGTCSSKEASNETYSQEVSNKTYSQEVSNGKSSQETVNETCSSKEASNGTSSQETVKETCSSKKASNKTYSQEVSNETSSQEISNETCSQETVNETCSSKEVSNETCSQEASNDVTSKSIQTSKIVMQDECCVVNLPLKNTKSNQTDVIENINMSQQTGDGVTNQSIQTCKVTNSNSSIQSAPSNSPTIKLPHNQEKQLCTEYNSNQSDEEAKLNCAVQTKIDSSEEGCDHHQGDVVIYEYYSENRYCDGKTKEVKRKYTKEIEKLQSDKKCDLEDLMKDCSLSDITTKFEQFRQLLEFTKDSSKSDSSSTSTSSTTISSKEFPTSSKKANCTAEQLSDSESISCCADPLESNSNTSSKESCSLEDFDIAKFSINEFFSLRALETGIQPFVENIKHCPFSEDSEEKKSSV